MQVNLDPNDEIARGSESKLDVVSETVSEAKHCEVSALHAHADNFRTNVSEGKSESCSI